MEKLEVLKNWGYRDGIPYIITETVEEEFVEVKEVVVDEDKL